MSRRIRGKGSYIRGELVFTTIDTLAPITLPAVANFHCEYSRIKTIFVSTEQLLTLTYGETHLALWPGLEPEIFNTISIECEFLRFGLFASGKYIEQYGVPKSIKDFKDHYFVCHNDQSKSHLRKWEQENIPSSRIALAAGTPSILHEGVLNGIGIGFVDLVVSKRHPSLVDVLAPKKDRWEVPLRLIIHEDVYNSDKIQAFLKMVEMTLNFWPATI
ncbi:MAG: LysR substrate-binding domain-containing protein [Verrucomicrobiota bacterium]